MNKIIITGATSMIGTALIEVAVREKVEVYAIVRSDTNRKDRIINSPLVHIIYASLEHLRDISSIPNDCDVFYHLAWAGGNKITRDDPLIHNKNIDYTLDAVELAKMCGCKRFVFAGTQAEYGIVEGVIDDNTRFSPELSYGVAKFAAGKLSKKLCNKNGIDHIWGRIFSVYGPHDNEGTMIDYALKCWGNGEKARFSAGTQSWNYLYESDAGEIFFRLGQDNVPEDTYFVANTESRPLREYIDILIKEYGDGADYEYGATLSARTVGLNVDMSKTVKAINYTPMVSFNEGIRKVIDGEK